MPSHHEAPDPLIRRHVAEQLLGPVDWQGDYGDADCPGADQHTNPGRECRIYVEGAPTIWCLHQSCALVIDHYNFTLRSQIGKAERGAEPGERRGSAEIDEAIRRNRELQLRHDRIVQRGREQLSRAILDMPWSIQEVADSSPEKLKFDPGHHWRMLLTLFASDDVVWLGEKWDSGPGKVRHFQKVRDWLNIEGDPCPYNFTCASTFAPGTRHRSNDSVARRPFLVVESDTLSIPDFLAVVRWLRTVKMRLRAIVDTGGMGKNHPCPYHAWFDMPNLMTQEDLRILLPAMGMDEKMFTASQPVRVPGSIRGGNGEWQKLIWFDGGAL
jgi:hypothetical protein